MDQGNKATVVPYNPKQDGDDLRAAMKGLGTDEKPIIQILTKRSNAQRQMIAKYFDEELDRDLIDDLTSELSGNFKEVIVGLMLPPLEYLCKQLNKAMKGAGTEEEVLIEILCSKNSNEIKALGQKYEEMYKRPLTEHLCGETSGELRRLLTYIATGIRDNGTQVNLPLAKTQAVQLLEAGENRFGTNESVFTQIIAKENFNHLKQVFEEYKNVAGNTIEHAIKKEFSGDLQIAMLAVVECVQSPPTYFAKKLYNAMHGAGTDDASLIRVIVSRSEIDLGTIKNEFERIYNKTLKSYINNDTSGDYKHALIALINKF